MSNTPHVIDSVVHACQKIIHFAQKHGEEYAVLNKQSKGFDYSIDHALTATSDHVQQNDINDPHTLRGLLMDKLKNQHLIQQLGEYTHLAAYKLGLHGAYEVQKQQEPNEAHEIEAGKLKEFEKLHQRHENGPQATGRKMIHPSKSPELRSFVERVEKKPIQGHNNSLGR